MSDIQQQIEALEQRAAQLAAADLSRASLEDTDAVILAGWTLAKEIEVLIDSDEVQPGPVHDLLMEMLTRVASSMTIAVCRSRAMRQAETEWANERARHASLR